MANTHEHLEHAEHATHHAHSGFDRKVALTIAIVAAVVATIGMIGHTMHNNTLIYTTQSGQEDVKKGQTEAHESNIWAQYQSKRLRQEMAKNQLALLTLQPVADDKKKERDDAVKKLNEQVSRYDGELAELKATAEKEQAKAKEIGKTAKKINHKAEHVHHQAIWFDFAHLSAELGLVLCSIAVLTKKKPFWFVGIVVTIIGIGLATYGYKLPDHHKDAPSAETKGH